MFITRTFSPAELAAIGAPADLRARLVADLHLSGGPEGEQRRVLFRYDGRTYAADYQRPWAATPPGTRSVARR